MLFSRLVNESADLEDALVRRLRSVLDDTSAEAFGDALYDAWYESGRDSKHKFAVFQLGIFASERRLDEVARRLGVEVSNGQHHYSTWCLEALARRGRALSNTASKDVGLSWVAHWARAATTESLGHRARELEAREREMRSLDDTAFAALVNPFVAADAADRAIVRVDLETRFTFGARSFAPTVVHGRLALRGDNGAVLEALPKRSPKDEPAPTRTKSSVSRPSPGTSRTCSHGRPPASRAPWCRIASGRPRRSWISPLIHSSGTCSKASWRAPGGYCFALRSGVSSTRNRGPSRGTLCSPRGA